MHSLTLVNIWSLYFVHLLVHVFYASMIDCTVHLPLFTKDFHGEVSRQIWMSKQVGGRGCLSERKVFFWEGVCVQGLRLHLTRCAKRVNKLCSSSSSDVLKNPVLCTSRAADLLPWAPFASPGQDGLPVKVTYGGNVLLILYFLYTIYILYFGLLENAEPSVVSWPWGVSCFGDL